jgi:hypothetical protein
MIRFFSITGYPKEELLVYKIWGRYAKKSEDGPDTVSNKVKKVRAFKGELDIIHKDEELWNLIC